MISNQNQNRMNENTRIIYDITQKLEQNKGVKFNMYSEVFI